MLGLLAYGPVSIPLGPNECLQRVGQCCSVCADACLRVSTVPNQAELRDEVLRGFMESVPDYQPRWKSGKWSGHPHTISAFLTGPRRSLSAFPSRRFEIPTSDGTGDKLVATWYRPQGVSLESEPNCPLITLLHGLGGNAESGYIRKSALYLLEHGRDVLLFNFRGAGESDPLCRKQNHPGRTEDLHDLFGWLPANSTPNLMACGSLPVGYSLGGNIMLKFLAESTEDFIMPAAMTVSAPLDLAATSQRLGRMRNLPYCAYLLYKMRRRILHEDEGQLSPEIESRVRWTTSIRAFDRDFTAPRNGYDSVDAYYADNSAVPSLPKINIPTVLLYALDDPFVPADAYEDFDWQQNPNLCPLLVERGGHVGFVEREQEMAWHNRCILHLANWLDAKESQ